MGMSYVFSRGATRDLLEEALPEDTREHGVLPPELGQLHVPLAHIKALHPDSVLVKGIRGSGKTLWWEALLDGRHRALIEAVSPKAGIKEGTRCAAGFGPTPKPLEYPSPDTLTELVDQGHEPRQIWRTVMARHVLDSNDTEDFTHLKRWSERLAWINADSERTALAFHHADQRLARNGLMYLVLFDALDRTAHDWPRLRALLRGLLQVLLEFRSFRAIRPKAFVRPDMLEDPEVKGFPDASKIIDGAVALSWPRRELYGLLWQRLGNAANGETFREGCLQGFRQPWGQRPDGVWMMPAAMRQDEELQRDIFHAMAGPWMGTDARRGFPYTWLPNHLGDAAQQTSPRSFVSAVQMAAKVSADYQRKYTDRPYALHYEALKQGVQRASTIRVEEISEDYPWVARLMMPLKGLSVPNGFQEIIARWPKTLLEELPRSLDQTEVRLPPRRFDLGVEGLKDDLLDLGIFQAMPGGRINIPDVYRVGFGLGRRGGVKPVGISRDT